MHEPAISDPRNCRAYPFLDRLEADVVELLGEALALDPALWTPMQGYQTGCLGFILEPGRFSHEFASTDFDVNRARCPRAAALITAIPGVELAGFLRVEPGGSMLPHTDPRDDHLVRAHLGLQLTEEEQAWWPAGSARLMDTRLSHWARNLGDFPRITMVLDVRMPFVVPEGAWGPWRPDEPGVARPSRPWRPS